MKVNHSIDISDKKIPEYAYVLRGVREKIGRTQRDIAESIGMTSMQLSHLENGRRIPRIDMLDTWATSLGLEMEISIVKR